MIIGPAAICLLLTHHSSTTRRLPCRELLPQANKQPAESQKYSELENTTTFGVAARRKRDNDPAVHTNQDMFSCGSLSARFSTERLVRSDGCNDYGFAR